MTPTGGNTEGSRAPFRYLFETLIRHLGRHPEDDRVIAELLETDLGAYWESALQAAESAPFETEALAYGTIDRAIAQTLRGKRNLPVLAEMYNRLPRDSAALPETTLEVARQVVKVAEELGRTNSDPVQYLRCLNNYVARLYQFASPGTLAEAEKAVRFARERSDADPEMTANRAQSFEMLANVLDRLGRTREAIEAIDGAATMYRTLAEQTPDPFERNLAICLNNRLPILDRLDRLYDAVASGREAASLFHRILKRQGAEMSDFPRIGLGSWEIDVKPDLATCLIALSTVLLRSGAKEETLQTVDESINILAALASDNPDAFGNLLGQAWNNRAMALGPLDRDEEALMAIGKAVDIFSDLARLQPRIFDPYLAHVLISKSTALLKLGQLGDSAEAAEAAADVYARIDDQERLLSTLDRLEAIYRDEGANDRADEALHRMEEVRLRPASPPMPRLD